MGGYRGYDKGLGRFPSLGGNTYHRGGGDMWRGRGVGITPSGGGNGSCGTSSDQRIHQYMAGGHISKIGLPPHL